METPLKQEDNFFAGTEDYISSVRTKTKVQSIQPF